MTYLISTDEPSESWWSIANRKTDWLFSPALSQSRIDPIVRARLESSILVNGINLDCEFREDPELTRQLADVFRTCAAAHPGQADTDEAMKQHLETLLALIERWNRRHATA